jgi:hypothetical protein
MMEKAGHPQIDFWRVNCQIAAIDTQVLTTEREMRTGP